MARCFGCAELTWATSQATQTSQKSLDELWMGQDPKTGEVMIGAWPSNMLEYNRRLIAKAERKDPDIDNRLKDESGDILF